MYEKIQTLLNEFETELSKFNELLKSAYGENSESSRLPYGISGHGFDEEDTGLESYCQETNQDLTQDSSELMRVLKSWSNSRDIYPKEWVLILMNRAYLAGKREGANEP